MTEQPNPGPDPTPQVPPNPAEVQQPGQQQGAATPAQPQNLDALRAEYEARYADLQKQHQVSEQKARHFQSEFDRLRTGAQSLAGNGQPPANPMQQFIDKYKG